MIDSRAVIADGAQIGADVEIGPYSIVGEGVEIGDRTKIGPHVVINGPCRIGRENNIFQFSSIGDAPQDKKYAGEPTRLVIGDRNTIREFCTINRGTAQDRGVTEIGHDNWIMAYVHIAHDCVVGNSTILANCTTLAGHVQVADHAILGGFTKVHQFCRIGVHSFCGMDTGLTRDLPPYVMASGHPAAPRGVNTEGLKRHDFGTDQIRAVRNAYKILYRSDLRLSEAVERIGDLAQDHEALVPLVEFLRASERSIVR